MACARSAGHEDPCLTTQALNQTGFRARPLARAVMGVARIPSPEFSSTVNTTKWATPPMKNAAPHIEGAILPLKVDLIRKFGPGQTRERRPRIPEWPVAAALFNRHPHHFSSGVYSTINFTETPTGDHSRSKPKSNFTYGDSTMFHLSK